jgi:hypothetical protein
MSGFKSWLYENDIVCFVLIGAEIIPASGRKTGKKNIIVALPVIVDFKRGSILKMPYFSKLFLRKGGGPTLRTPYGSATRFK